MPENTTEKIVKYYDIEYKGTFRVIANDIDGARYFFRQEIHTDPRLINIDSIKELD